VDLPRLEAQVKQLEDVIVEVRATIEVRKAQALAHFVGNDNGSMGFLDQAAANLDDPMNVTQSVYERYLRHQDAWNQRLPGQREPLSIVEEMRDLGSGRKIVRVTDKIRWDAAKRQWVRPDGQGISVFHTQYYGVKDGRVVAWRTTANGTLPGLLGDTPTKKVIDDPLDWLLNNSSATAVTAKSQQKQGWAGALIDQHWDDAGIDTWDKVENLLKKGSFSKGGANLNKRQVEKFAKKQVAAAKAAHEELKRTFERATMEQRALIGEFNRLKTMQRMPQALMQPAYVPVENARNMTGFAVVDLGPGGKFGMPEFMAQEFARASAGYKTLEGFHKGWRQFNSWWKTMATWLWPGFHVRNAMGAYFNNWLGGVAMKDYVTNRRIRMAAREVERVGVEGYKWAKMPVRKMDPDIVATLKSHGYSDLQGVPIDDITYADLADLQVNLGLTSANGRAFAEAELPAEALERRGGSPKGRLEGSKAIGWYVKGMRGAGTMTENMFRGAAFVRGLRDYGDLMEARAFTMVRHGDYSDLTDFEYNVVRDLIPFYKWMRTNIPFQLHQLFENPGKLLAMVKAQDAVFTAQGRDYSEDRYRMPAWMQNQFVIPIGSKEDAFNAVMLDLPMSDLFMSSREFVSSFLPLVRPFLESFIYEKSTFSGAPIEGDLVPLNDIFNPVAPLLQAVGIAKTGEDGRPYISDKMQNMLGMIPAFSRARNWLYEDADRVKLRAGTLMSAYLGVGLRPVDQEEMAQAELDFYYNNVLPEMEHLKQLGMELPTSDDIESTLGSIDTVLSRLGIVPGPAGQGG
jgi:hypothetical protein